MIDTIVYEQDTNRPAILIFSDSEIGAAHCAHAAEAVGARIVANEPIETAIGRLDRQVAMGAVMLDITRDHGTGLDVLLDRLDGLARYDGVAVIVSVPLSLIDVVAARTTGATTVILSEPAINDRAAALALALGEKAMVFNDVSAEIDVVRLRRLADEVGRIARSLAKITSHDSASALMGEVRDVHLAFASEPPEMPTAAALRQMIRLRRLRDTYFDAALFADPAWDMLLDLLAARIEDDRVAVSSLCIAAAVPPTTGLRWIKEMTDRGLFERHADPDDGRRIFIRLSEPTAIAMGRYFAAARKMGGVLI
jgi:Winged helix DNA-binding domain